MKEQIKNFYKNPMLVVFIIILVFFMPIAIFSPGESRNRGVITAVGLDKQGEDYEISLLTFIPTTNQTFQEQNSVISGKGDSVAKAVYNAQIAMGRKIGLSHAKTTIVNEELLSEDVAVHLDYLSRIASLPENTVFVSTNGSAKELLESAQDLKENIGLKLEQVVGFNAENVYVNDTSLEAFYKGYYSQVKSSIIGYICLRDKQEESEINVSTQKTEPSSSSSSVSEQSTPSSPNGEMGNQKKDIINCGETLLIKNGKKVETLTLDMINGINILNPKSINQIIKIKDVEIKGQKVDLCYKIKEKRVLVATKFVNGYPICSAQLILNVELMEVDGDNDKLKVNTEFSEITEEIASKIDLNMKEKFTEAIKLLKINKTDVIGITEKFYRNNRKDYNKFVKNLEDSSDFIEHVNFKLNVVVNSD